MTELLRILDAGDRALLLEPADPADLPLLVESLRGADFQSLGIEDLVPAAGTVLLTLTSAAERTQLIAGVRAAVAALAAAGSESGCRAAVSPGAAASPGAIVSPGAVVSRGAIGPVVEIPVRYDGIDLQGVASRLGISADDVIGAHTSAQWRCAFVGFAPGFGYLTAPDWGLEVPRHEQSRTSVPAGSVAIADAYSAVYPRTSPGGWQIIGTTELQMWDLARSTPNLLGPGTVVRFREVRK